MSSMETKERDRQHIINSELVRFLYDQSTFVSFGSMGIALFVCFLLWDIQPRHELLIWTSCVLTIAIIRTTLERRLPKKTTEQQNRRWHHIAIAITAVSGTVWGGGLWHFTDISYTLEAAALFMVIAGMSSASFASTAAYSPATNLAFILPANGILILGYTSTGLRSALVIGVLHVIYLIMLRGFALSNHRKMVEQIRLRMETAQLAQDLEDQHAVAASANMAKSRFLAAAAHDLRQPLQAITLFSSLLGKSDDEVQHQTNLNSLHEATHALGNLLNTLLDISRLDSEQIQPQLQSLELQPILQRLDEEHRTQATNKGLAWQVNCQPGTVHSDPVLLENILRNLISNALRYTPEGAITISCERRDQQVAIMVCDTGIGIPADELDAIFEEFYQVGNPERDRRKGLGLGMAIVKRTAALVDARIEVQSEVGRGSCFTLTLPAGETLPPAVTPPPGLEHTLDGLVVAFVDDEPDIRHAMAALLQQWGCTAVVADALPTLLQQLADKALQPQVLISDYRLRGEQNGLELINAFQLTQAMPVPSMLLTGESTPELLQALRDSGHTLLQKPVQPARLRAFLMRQFGQPAPHEAG